MLNKVRQYIEAHGMIQPGHKVVLGLSGGADSVALLHIMMQLREPLQIELFAAHVNHGLRGQAARDDAEFARTLCRRWDVPFFLKEADVRALSQTLHKSEEEAGRLVRYDFFLEVMGKIKGDRIATAHHKNDQAETILHNILRGTGLQGLTGIKPVRDGFIIRPLLDITRREIEEYIKQHQLEYRQDASNSDTVYTRNRIRSRLLPSLANEYNPDIVESLARMGSILREEDDFLTGYCNHIYRDMASITPSRITIDLQKLVGSHPALQRRLVRMAVADLRGDLDGVGYDHVEAVIRLAAKSGTGSKTIIPADSRGKGRIIAEISYDSLIFREASEESQSDSFNQVLPIPGQVILENPNLTVAAEKWDKTMGLSFSSRCIYIDEEKIKGGLYLRRREEGDRFKPLGMQGSKKLKDYFIDRKIPREQRDSIPLLADDENIIWVVGLHLNHDYRITESTGSIVKISIQKRYTDGG